MQEFFKNTILSKFIKSILYNSSLFTIPTCSFGDYVVNGFTYIYNHEVILCTKSGKIDVDATYSKISTVDTQKYLSKISLNYYSPYSYYDSETHEKLGDYLRQKRDVQGINLMPFYNCFSNVFASGISIQSNKVTTKSSSAFKIAKVPIKLNQTYTIAIDSSANVSICPVFMNGNILIEYPASSSNVDLTEKITQSKYQTVKYYTSTSFTAPIVYSIDLSLMDESDLTLFKYYEDYLYLLIQLPKDTDSSIVVLEGDFTHTRSTLVFDVEHINEITTNHLNELLLSKLTLLQFNTKTLLPYSNRLIEYLLQNVITQEDDFWKDIYNMQETLGNYPIFMKMKGVWEPVMRYKVFYDCLHSVKTRKLDLNGYVDKDAENMYAKRWQNG